ncbi:hypothetical protein GXW71_22190 [Roseomonas hellenica]|uniref:FecR protein domain-containing protein n=1 Tax=Plastoroseomonas hellenica TaxID=2687306 RepID=A0ABS5F3P3_9PROT|nr:hypothetical protein [Plastoroseomonas hellenica]MBR0667088.1 hypothetical protein [Plastoroseomonas hellenica]
MAGKVLRLSGVSASRIALLASAAALALLRCQDAAAQTIGGPARPAPSVAPGAAPRMPDLPPVNRAASVRSATAPASISAFILRGRAVRGAAAADPQAPTRLAAGMRVESPAGTWTEIAFSDGSSIVLQAGADFTLQGIAMEGGRVVIRGAASRGSLRASTSDTVEMLVQIGGTEVRVVGASAVIEAGANGAATMLSGRRVTVRRSGGAEEVIRRPGFAVALDRGGPERRTRGQMAASLEPFAPVQVPEGGAQPSPATASPGELAGAQSVPPETEQHARRRHSETQLAALGAPTARGTALSTGVGSYLATPAAGSAIAGGGTALQGSTQASFNATPLPGTAQDGVLLGGVHARMELGTGRVRRFPAEAAGGNPRRVDAGQVATAGTVGLVGAAFAGPAGTGSPAASDLVANIGMVTLTAFSPGPDAANIVEMPRLAISTGREPTATWYRNADQRLLGQIALPDRRDQSGAIQETSRSMEVRANSVYTLFATRRVLFSTYGLSDSDAIAGLEAALRESGFYDSLDPATGTVTAFTPFPMHIMLAYRRSTVLETNLQAMPADTSPGGVQTPTGFPRTVDGRGVLASLPDGGGSIMYFASADAAVPQAAVTGVTNSNPEGTRFNERIPQQAPSRFTLIYDTIVSGSSPAFATQVRQGTLVEGERYFVIGGTPVPGTATGMPGISGAGQVTRYAISDGLNPTGGLAMGQTIEAQFRGPGDPNQPVLFNRYNASRPEGTFAGDGVRADTHLLVASGNGATPNVAMRADLDIVPGGGSSASISVGGVGLDRSGVSLVLSGSTVGTARLGGGPVAIGGRFGSLGTDATGTQAHMFYGAESGEQVGHFAVGQQDVRRGSPGADGGQPGTVEVLGGASSPFGFTRLATNVTARTGQPRPADIAPQGGAVSFLGFATGFVETPQGGQLNLHSVSAPGYGIAIERPEGSNEFAAVIDLTPRAPGQMALNPFAAGSTNGASGTQRLEFGARDPRTGQPTTAWVGAGTFAAVRPGTVAADGVTTRADGAALVSVDPTLQQAVPAMPGYQMPTSSEHMAWGFFMGDLVNDSGGTRRDHANLGFWVAGRPVDFATLSTLRGTFTYSGGMLGTAAQNGGLRVAAGGFTQTWDFGSRSGRLAATFDGRDYNARVAMLGTNPVFTGSGLDGLRDRRMVVQGGFFGPAGAGAPPPTVGGAFGIAGSGYAANGIFAGRRAP